MYLSPNRCLSRVRPCGIQSQEARSTSKPRINHSALKRASPPAVDEHLHSATWSAVFVLLGLLLAASLALKVTPAYAKYYRGEYMGQDEPAVAFYSDIPGSGNSSMYLVTIPREPPSPAPPNAT